MRGPGDSELDDSASADGMERDPQSLGEHVERVRLGHGANCSSIGSVVDTLFATATVGAAVFAAIAAALAKEPVQVIPKAEPPPDRPKRPERSP